MELVTYSIKTLRIRERILILDFIKGTAEFCCLLAALFYLKATQISSIDSHLNITLYLSQII